MILVVTATSDFITTWLVCPESSKYVELTFSLNLIGVIFHFYCGSMKLKKKMYQSNFSYLGGFYGYCFSLISGT